MSLAPQSQSVAAEAAPNQTRLFAAFQRFCLDTDAGGDAIASAVEAAGGTVEPNAVSPPSQHWRSWEFVAEGVRMRVVATSAPPTQPKGCMLFDPEDGAASLPAIQSWLATRNQATLRSPVVYLLRHTSRGWTLCSSSNPADELSGPKTKAALQAGLAADDVWSLSVTAFQGPVAPRTPNNLTMLWLIRLKAPSRVGAPPNPN
jgi:hypothetical protein